MCGICGFVGLTDEDLVIRMTQQLTHRGPDGGGYYLGEGVALGHRRLSIIDLETGRQPMASANGRWWISYNGEIYNYREIRRRLEGQGYRFYTASDTEVVLRAYEAYGPQCLQQFNGMWAFAIWDEQERRLFMARDRLGIKPVCYLQQGERLFFASEYKALLELEGFDTRLDLAAADAYLGRRYVPGNRTLMAGIRRLPPGHYMVWQDGQVRMQRYWSLSFSEEERPVEQWRDAFCETFTDAVRQRLVSDVPLGAYLSGGVDSSAVVGTMAALGHRPLETFSVGFGGPQDEGAAAAAFARHCKARHHHLGVEADDLDEVVDCVWSQDDPVGDVIALPLYRLSRYARDHVKVVLTGEGADELLGGYVHQQAVLKAARLDRWLPGPVRRAAAYALRRTPVAWLDRAFPYPDSLGVEGRERLAAFIGMNGASNRYNYMGALFTPRERDGLFSVAVQPARQILPAGGLPAGLSLANQLIAAEFNTWLPDNILFKQDRLAMAHGIEARVPFLDHRLVELCARMPVWHKSGPQGDKQLLRQAVQGLVPEANRQRQKQAFYMPLNGKFHRRFMDLATGYLTPARVRRRGLFNGRVIDGLISGVAGASMIAYKKLMAVVILEIWCDLFLDGTAKSRLHSGQVPLVKIEKPLSVAEV